MTRMEIKSRIGPDGVLNLSIPLGRSEANQEVVVTVQPVASPRDPQTWRRSVEETAGTIQDPTFVRHDQGDFEARADWR